MALALAHVSAGTIAGVIVALAAGRMVRGFLFEIPPNDPVTFILTIGLVALVSAVAAFGPVRRATSVNPIEALRAE